MRLVGEYAEQGLAEQIAAFLFIPLVRASQKLLHRIAVEGIEIGVTVVKLLRPHMLDEVFFHDIACFGLFALFDGIIIAKFVVFVASDRKTAQLRRDIHALFGNGGSVVFGNIFKLIFEFFGHFAARCAGGPAVLVVQPRGHAQFFRFFRGGADQIEPIFAEILGRKPRTAVHEKAAEPHFF